MFQGAALLGSLTVRENVALRLHEHHQGAPADFTATVRRVLEQVELGDLQGKLPPEISGGMRKRP